MDFENKDKVYIDYHPWNRVLEYDCLKKLFYFQDPIHYSNSTYKVLGDYVWSLIEDLPENKKILMHI